LPAGHTDQQGPTTLSLRLSLGRDVSALTHIKRSPDNGPVQGSGIGDDALAGHELACSTGARDLQDSIYRRTPTRLTPPFRLPPAL